MTDVKLSRDNGSENIHIGKDSQILGARLKDIENEVKSDKNKLNKSEMIEKRLGQDPQKPMSASLRKKSEVVKDNNVAKSRPDSSQAPPKSAKSRPQSRQGQQSRVTSRQGSRPSSRANSRLGSGRTSRAAT